MTMNLLYMMNEWKNASLIPAHFFAQSAGETIDPFKGINPFIDWFYATSNLLSRTTMIFDKPEFGINDIAINDQIIEVKEEIIFDKTFCELRYFKRSINGAPYKLDAPSILLVAPLSGHFSTLLRGTVQTLLHDFNVYITDWKDCKHIPVEDGDFSLDTYIAYLLDFIRFFKDTPLHIMAVCQPIVPVLAAVSLLAEDKKAKQPQSMILLGGPIDTRINPGKVNDFCQNHDVKWVTRNMISKVPQKYKGKGRNVLPGFLMLSSFMSLNPDKHKEAISKFYQHLVQGDEKSAEKHEEFYNEYRAVMDLPEAYFIDCYEKIFRDFDFPKGKFYWDQYHVQPNLITKTALLTIEGELDDISPVGQTKAAHTLCSNIPKSMQKYHLQKGVGHYGIFNGSRWSTEIYPIIKNFIKTHQ